MSLLSAFRNWRRSRTAAPTMTSCWKCSTPYPIESLQCPKCCASNANVDLASAEAERADASKIDHEWKFQDDSFDHEFGTERVHYWLCERCGATSPMDHRDYDDFDDNYI